MFRNRWILAGVMLLVMPCANLSAQTAEHGMTRGNIIRTNTYEAGTQAFEAVRRFIVSHSNADQRASLENARAWPASFTVTSTTRIHTSKGFVQAQDASGPPVGLPPTGNTGDTLSISACRRNVSETWTYVWDSMGGGAQGWILQKYTWQSVTKCKDMTSQ
jgi:hypothetical protein